MTEPTTPLMRQYSAIKKEHPSALLFFRLGDFYELFFDDAVLAAKELQITLTARNKEKGVAIPMCGVPFHAAEGYIGKLIRKGYKVAVCDQTEDPRLAKKLVRREVTRVVTPGTAADSALGSEENNFLAAVVSFRGQAGGDRAGFAALDLSTGEFRATEFSGDGAEQRIQDELLQLRPKELLYGSSAPLFDRAGNEPAANLSAATAGSPMQKASGSPWALTPLDDWIFAPDHAIPLLENHFVCSRLKASDWPENQRRRQPLERFFTTYVRPSAESLITWTASGFTSATTAWCWTRSRCAIWS